MIHCTLVYRLIVKVLRIELEI